MARCAYIIIPLLELPVAPTQPEAYSLHPKLNGPFFSFLREWPTCAYIIILLPIDPIQSKPYTINQTECPTSVHIIIPVTSRSPSPHMAYHYHFHHIDTIKSPRARCAVCNFAVSRQLNPTVCKLNPTVSDFVVSRKLNPTVCKLNPTV